VKFTTGADFTGRRREGDLRTASCIPPKGIVIPRTPLFATVGEFVVVDPHKIEFRMTEARPGRTCSAPSRAAGNIIVRKKTLDDNRAISSGHETTGGPRPFKHVSRQDKEV